MTHAEGAGKARRILAALALALAVPAFLPAASTAVADGGYSPLPPPDRPQAPRPPPPGSTPTGPPPVTGAPKSPTTPQTGGPASAPGRGIVSGGGWRTWWEANADALRPPHPDRATPDSGLFRPGDSPAATRGDAAHATRRLVERDVLPLLRATAEAGPHEDPDIVAAALIALGKVTASTEDVELLLRTLGRRDVNAQVRRSAAMGLGLLRRSRREDAFDGRLLDRIRARLLAAGDDEKETAEVRCFATFSMGLLGDQPTNPDDAFAKEGRLVVRDLWLRLEDPATRGEDLPVALLLALSLQPREGVPTAVIDGLRACCTTGRLGSRTVSPFVRSHAVLALARLSDAESHGLLLGIAKSRSHDLALRRSAVIGLSVLAPRLDTLQRLASAAGLVDVAQAADPDTAGLALLTVGRLLAADFAGGSDIVATTSPAVEALCHAADAGQAEVRPFAALALALACRPAPRAEGLRTFAQLRDRAAALLRDGAASPSHDADIRGGFCIALGLLGDDHALGPLVALAREHRTSPALVADACTGLGLLGHPSTEALSTLRAALGDSPDPRLRREAARALGLLGDVASIPTLLPALEAVGDDYVRARAALALGAIGDPAPIPALSLLARSRTATDAVRSLAISALGIVSDPEAFPSLSRLGVDSNYLARTAALHEAFGLL